MSKEIKLTKGQVAIVDDEDYIKINQYKWCVYKKYNGKYYAKRGIKVNKKSKSILMHRQILDYPDTEEIDHINGNGLDNRKENIRICNRSQNKGNVNKYSNNLSGYKGVCWCKVKKRWRVTIQYIGKQTYLGYFDDIIEAAKIYDKKARELFGKFAKTNFIDISDWT